MAALRPHASVGHKNYDYIDIQANETNTSIVLFRWAGAVIPVDSGSNVAGRGSKWVSGTVLRQGRGSNLQEMLSRSISRRHPYNLRPGQQKFFYFLQAQFTHTCTYFGHLTEAVS